MMESIEIFLQFSYSIFIFELRILIQKKFYKLFFKNSIIKKKLKKTNRN